MKRKYLSVICLILAMTMLLTACGSKNEQPAASASSDSAISSGSDSTSADVGSDSTEAHRFKVLCIRSNHLVSESVKAPFENKYEINQNAAEKIDEALAKFQNEYPDEFFAYASEFINNDMGLYHVMSAYSYAVGFLGESKLSKGKEPFGIEEAKELFKNTVLEFDEFLKYNANVDNYPSGALPWMHFLPEYLMENNGGYSTERLGFRLWDDTSLSYEDMLENDRGGGSFKGYNSICTRIIEEFPELDGYATTWFHSPCWNDYAKNLGNAFYNYKLNTKIESIDSISDDRWPAENTEIQRYYAYKTLHEERDIMMGYLGFIPYMDDEPNFEEHGVFSVRSPLYHTTFKGYEVGYIITVPLENTFTRNWFELAVGYDETLGGYFIIDEYDEELATINTSNSYLEF